MPGQPWRNYRDVFTGIFKCLIQEIIMLLHTMKCVDFGPGGF
ncbi:hypothetical protein FORC69_4760 [Escherichia coli]|nr:hypothetical protein FORC69_4760 [Escherichia coli]KDX00602.1 hypothetical protein AD27_5612 [Escherichia coli 2-177-06_S4_C3]